MQNPECMNRYLSRFTQIFHLGLLKNGVFESSALTSRLHNLVSSQQMSAENCIDYRDQSEMYIFCSWEMNLP